MDKCYVSLAGGVGNQLFQAAAGFAYSKEHGKELMLDSNNWSASQGIPPSFYKKSIFRNFNFEKASKYSTPIHEEKFNYTELPHKDGDVVLHGYFQSLKYFEDVQDEFKRLVELSPIDCNREKFKNVVAMHVRRGDYLQHHTIHHVCDTNYFVDAAIEHFNSNPIHIYTDSPSYVLEEFDKKLKHFSIIETKDELQDLYMLGIYDNVICSNSSFSWWGTFLGCPKQKIIVPDIWFKNYENHDDIYRSEFIRRQVKH